MFAKGSETSRHWQWNSVSNFSEKWSSFPFTDIVERCFNQILGEGGPFEVTTMFHTQKYFCPYRDLSKYFFAKSKTNKIVKCPDKTLFATKIDT